MYLVCNTSPILAYIDIFFYIFVFIGLSYMCPYIFQMQVHNKLYIQTILGTDYELKHITSIQIQAHENTLLLCLQKWSHISCLSNHLMTHSIQKYLRPWLVCIILYLLYSTKNAIIVQSSLYIDFEWELNKPILDL